MEFESVLIHKAADARKENKEFPSLLSKNNSIKAGNNISSPLTNLQETIDNRVQGVSHSRVQFKFGEVLTRSVYTSSLEADIHEQEADRLADQVMVMPKPRLLPSSAACSGDLSCSRSGKASQIRRKADSNADGTRESVRNFSVDLRPGRPLDAETRAFFELRFGHDFRDVRVHTDAESAESLRAVGGLAYTVGRNVAFAEGLYSPTSSSGRRLLAHELIHVMQQSAIQSKDGVMLQRQSDSGAQSSPASNAGIHRPPIPASSQSLQDYVFLMGYDDPRKGNPFYRNAERFYRARIPTATFATDLRDRSLNGMLNYITKRVPHHIDNLYIVSHASEDGTLLFGLNASDRDKKLSVNELRNALHPTGGGQGGLPLVSNQIDERTHIRVKGCNLGRTQEMVELLDEAFGGAGVVTAPTHEQDYGFDPSLEQQARRKFRADVESTHPLPPQVNPYLPPGPKGANERKKEERQRQVELNQRQQAIRKELTARRTEENTATEKAGVYEKFEGPMFQRPGATRFTETEMSLEVGLLYAHLPKERQRDLVRRLVSPDSKATSTSGQEGQRIDKRTVYRYQFEINPYPKPKPDNAWLKAQGPDDDSLIAKGRAKLQNPDSYRLSVERSHQSTAPDKGITRANVVAERVIAYLWHGNLDSAAHQHFNPPEPDVRYFSTSTFH